MNNEEKARELAGKHSYVYNDEWSGYISSGNECFNSSLEMAEWKDNQFLELIDKKLDYARSKIEEMHGKTGKLKYEGMRKILLELKKNI